MSARPSRRWPQPASSGAARSRAHRGRAAARCRAMAISPPMPRWCWPRMPGMKPRDLAEEIAAELRSRPDGRQGRRRRAGLHQSDARAGGVARRAAREIVRAGADYGRGDIGAGEPVNVEYVSANPTGPMHVGHCRGAVFGDALANLLAFAGFDGDARILHQRRRRAGRRARALGLPALPRGARRKHRRDSGGALSRRLSQAGRRGAGRRNTATSSRRSRRASGCRSCAPRPST